MLHRADQDVGFWLQLAQWSGGPVLELACGTGRLTMPLARAGVDIVGVDRDRVMLAAMPRTNRPFLVASDMRRFALARTFRLIFVGYNSLQLLTPPGAMIACLDCARQHLAPGGLVGVEVTDFQVGIDRSRAAGLGRSEDDALVPLGDAEGIRLSGSLVHDLGRRTSRYRRRFEGDGWAVEDEVVVRSVDRAELEAVFQEAGLEAITWWTEGATLRALAGRPM